MYFNRLPVNMTLWPWVLCAVIEGTVHLVGPQGLYGQSKVGLEGVYEGFKHPPAEFSMVPLMRINDAVKREELRWQMTQMREQGIGSVFLLPEWLGPSYGWKDAGMPYPYLSPEYFKIVQEFAEEARKAGLGMWVYDELDWPSGNAGGRIVDVPEYRSAVVDAATYAYKGPRSIVIDLKPDAEVVGVTAYEKHGSKVEENSIENLTSRVSNHHLTWSIPDGDWEVAVYYLKSNKGFFYPYDADLMNAQAMKSFIDMTHGKYRKRVQESLGIKIHGTFTDEPHISSFRNYQEDEYRCRYLPWTAKLPETFRKWKGYDICDRLPLLYLEGGPETAKVRCDFWQVVSKMFEEIYFGQIAAFDHAAGWISTGHLNGEENFWWHLIFDGGDEFSHQRQMDYPGLDWILPFDYSSHWEIGWLAAFAGKLVSSAAHVYDKPRVMEETFAGVGYGVSLEQMHRMVNWAYLLGVNMLVPITYKYSLRGADRATSYPGISYQQPWWLELRGFSDYVSRLSYLLSQGHFEGKVAILLPVPEVWANSQDREYLEALTRKVHWITDGLLRERYDFDFIDDDSLRGASFDEGQIRIRGNRYEVLILPPMRVASLEAMRKVEDFHQAGGAVIAVDRVPSGSMERGDPDAEMASVVTRIFGSPTGSRSARAGLVYLDETAGTVLQALGHYSQRPVVLQGQAEGVDVQHRRVGESDIFFLVNTDGVDKSFEARFREKGGAEIWDAETGNRELVAGAEELAAETRISFQMDPYEAYFVVFNSALPAATARRAGRYPVDKVEIGGEWDFQLRPTMTEPHIAWNFTPLPEGWKLKPTDYGKINRLRAGSWAELGLPYYSGKGIYEKSFEFGGIEEGRRYFLDLGKVGVAARVWINGKPMGSRLWRPYRFDITSGLRSGENRLQIEVANTLANYFSQFEQLKDAPLYAGGSQPWMLPSGLMGPVTILAY